MTVEPKPPKLILVVEDDDGVREGLAFILRADGYEVALAKNGEEAWQWLQAHPVPHLLLLDMLMPVLDGWHFLTRMRREGQEHPLPVIIMTGTILSQEWAEAHGCSGFVRKPVGAGPLLEEIRRCLSP